MPCNAHRPLHLKRRPLIRDICFYTLALSLLLSSFEDGKVGVNEALPLMAVYFAYIAVVFLSPIVRSHYRVHVLRQAVTSATAYITDGNSQASERHEADSLLAPDPLASGQSESSLQGDEDSLFEPVPLPSSLGRGEWGHEAVDADQGNAHEHHHHPTSRAHIFLQAAEEEQERQLHPPSSPDATGAEESPARPRSQTPESQEYLGEADLDHELDFGLDPEGGSLCGRGAAVSLCAGALQALWVIPSVMLLRPVRALLSWTVPKCERNRPSESLYPITFTLSFAWIAVFSFVLSAVVERWGALSGLPLSMLGFSTVAIGAEIPDLIQSLVVAKRGWGSMAVSAAIGSQITNLCLGLGLPWALADMSGAQIAVTDHRKIRFAVLMQFANEAVVVAMLLGPVLLMYPRHSKALLGRAKAVVMLSLYVLIQCVYIWYSTRDE